jgi:hypothetical protein
VCPIHWWQNNVLYDFDGLSPWFVPYLGVGIGYEAMNERWNAFNNLSFSTTRIAPPALTTFQPGGPSASGQGTEGSFAYQAILGAAVPLYSYVPGLAFTAEYRFLGTAGNRNYGGTVTSVSTTAGVTTTRVVSGGASFGPSYNHALLLGLRYNFGVAPPAPPAPPPIAAPSRSYLVFFDWDKATLTDRARQIIREAADNSTHVQYTRIEVNGHTDTSGTPHYNQGLSVRRAKAVRQWRLS